MLLFYGKWRQQPVWWALVGMFGAAFIGFFSKEDALMVLPLIALYEFFIRRENLIALTKQKAFQIPAFALGALAVIYLALRQSIISGCNQGQRENGFTGWLSTLPVIFTTYLRQLVWPDPMCVDQPVDYSAGFGIAFWLSILALAACGAVLFVRRETWSRWQFALSFFLLRSLPSPASFQSISRGPTVSSICQVWLRHWPSDGCGIGRKRAGAPAASPFSPLRCHGMAGVLGIIQRRF